MLAVDDGGVRGGDQTSGAQPFHPAPEPKPAVQGTAANNDPLSGLTVPAAFRGNLQSFAPGIGTSIVSASSDITPASPAPPQPAPSPGTSPDKRVTVAPSTFAVIDGLVRSASTTFQQLAGSALSSFQGAVISTMAVEVVRTTFGIVRGGIRSGVPSLAQCSLMGVWAVNAVVMTVGHVVAFRLGADQGVATMIVMASVLPGMLVDRLFFKDKPTLARTFGAGVLLAGCYVAIGAPGLGSNVGIGWWVGIKAGIACLLAVNEGARRMMVVLKERDPVQHSLDTQQAWLWVGGISLATLVPVALMSGAFKNIASYSTAFWAGTVGMAAAVVVSTGLSLAVYQGGGSVVARKVITTATTVAAAVAMGVLFFGEALTVAKATGGLLVIGAGLLMALDRKK